MQNQYYQLLYHFIWATRMREPIIDDTTKPGLYKYLRGKVVQLGGTPLAVGGIANHVHLVLAVPPTISIATFIGKLKGASSHWINHVLSPQGNFAWQSGYGAFSVAKSGLATACNYVNNQEEHHRAGTLRARYEEMRGLRSDDGGLRDRRDNVKGPKSPGTNGDERVNGEE